MSDLLYTLKPEARVIKPGGVLIKKAAPKYFEPEGMDGRDDHIIRPGSSPPLIYPLCARCKIPVEKFTIDMQDDEYRLGIDAQCHGQHGGKFFTIAELFHKRKHGQSIVFFD